MAKTTFGLVIGSRQFFPADLCRSGRETMLQVMEEEGFCAVALSEQDTKYGAVSTLDDAVKCGEFLKQHAGEIDGLVISLPNFGDEKAVANSLRFSGLNVPVLVQAYPDDRKNQGYDTRRDGFCGKMSVCNNLYQYGIPFSLPRLHTEDPRGAKFRADLRRFAATCRVVKGLRKARIGCLGARPAAFNTVRYSEKILERAGVSVETLDLSEATGRANALPSADAEVQAKLRDLKQYVRTNQVPEASLDKMARFGVVVDRWMTANRLDATAFQCWTAMEEYFGIIPCTVMSMMSNKLMPSACETDVVGALSMYALALATGEPSALVDWNNNYEEEEDKGVIFHCSNIPVQIFTDIPVMTYNPSIAGDYGQENAYGIMVGRMKAEPITYLRIGTDDVSAKIHCYMGEGQLTNDPLETYGGYGVVQIPRFQELLQHICFNGFEHHVAITQNLIGPAIYDALTTYMGWPVYYHK
jgi:L-fucose isomerase-like protein